MHKLIQPRRKLRRKNKINSDNGVPLINLKIRNEIMTKLEEHSIQSNQLNQLNREAELRKGNNKRKCFETSW